MSRARVRLLPMSVDLLQQGLNWRLSAARHAHAYTTRSLIKSRSYHRFDQITFIKGQIKRGESLRMKA